MATKKPKADAAAPRGGKAQAQPPDAPERDAPRSTAVRKVAFTMLPVQDVERARRFYEQTLGLTVGLHGGQNGMWWIEYDLAGGGCIALTNTTGAEPSALAGATLALEVDDLPALIEQLKDAGVRFRGEVVRGPRCRMVSCLDSEGNALLLHQLDRKQE
jgi:predicted enzyme related to lactoylglutathione lyase